MKEGERRVQDGGPARAPRRAVQILVPAVALLLIFGSLVLPSDALLLSPDIFRSLPLGLPVLVAAMVVAPATLAPLVAGAATVFLSTVVIVKLADMAAYAALSRPFNPVLDLYLLEAAWNVLSGAFGTFGALLIAAAAVLTILLVIAATWLCVRALHRAVREHRVAAGAATGLLLVLGFAGPMLYPDIRAFDFTSNFSFDLLRKRAQSVAQSLNDVEAFEQAARNDPATAVPDDALFAELEGKDVFMFFVESYGRTVLDDPRYAPSVRPVLSRFEDVIEQQGYHAASGYLTSPVAGGQSWLGQTTVLAGLWVDNQRRYNALIASDRATLISDFSRAGWRSVAVMPAITMAWPEGEAFGYDVIYDADALGYRGLPFNWVTMPDQYTLSALHRLELAGEDRPRVFAEVALISSHAPWTPIPEVIPWPEVGDGTVFNAQARNGDTPKEVWSDPARVRVQYRKSIEYALADLASFVKEKMEDNFLLIILGDHQPARVITGPDASRDVPYHVVSDDAGLVAEVLANWNAAPGMLPDGVDAERMSVFRERLIKTFSRRDGPLPMAR